MQRLLDAMTGTPVLVINGRTDVRASNALGRALFAPLHDTTTRPPHHARSVPLARCAQFSHLGPPGVRPSLLGSEPASWADT
ncbi:MmyB family transcriptional regulator [Streptomyces mirabilis]|uniref:MmyB family transcriptional regulator n=1 Tax=Streptomyces TaxID=1883 RepID=UPI0029B2EDF3|nr:hypothetical protein [Streptomyces sp. AK02-04a]MDX3759250.1 hypothetical protein [Streptomyces sp. AK02-04a]